MDHAVDLDRTSTLHIHPSGALTFCGLGEWPGSDDDAPLLAVEA